MNNFEESSLFVYQMDVKDSLHLYMPELLVTQLHSQARFKPEARNTLLWPIGLSFITSAQE